MPHPAELVRLSDLPDRTPALLAEIRGGHHLTRRLLSLGLRQGSLLSVVQRRSQGLVLASGEVRIAIGAGIAEKLWVNPCELAGTAMEQRQTGAGSSAGEIGASVAPPPLAEHREE